MLLLSEILFNEGLDLFLHSFFMGSGPKHPPAIWTVFEIVVSAVDVVRDIPQNIFLFETLKDDVANNAPRKWLDIFHYGQDVGQELYLLFNVVASDEDDTCSFCTGTAGKKQSFDIKLLLI